ncbi:MAG: protein kinase [Planctomycetia bacterium]|nr:protein kinase [Planctomycetia bacterium]
MPISIHEFWKLAVESRLLSPARAKALHAAFTGLKGATAQANVASLAEWLVAQRAMTRYQASLLAAGRPGPFVLGEYVIHDRIESGRLAGLYRATHQASRRVLLIFAAQITSDPEQYPWLAETAQQLAVIDSPHVSGVARFVSAGANSFLVLPDLTGRTLGESFAQKRATSAQACHIAFQAGLGLLAIHGTEHLHGDLRPENIWIEPSGSVKLLHFPLVVTPADSRAQRAQADYQAPELHHQDRLPDKLTDIYSLGCTIYELIAGRVVFPGGSVQQKMQRHESEIPQRLDHIVPGTSEPLARLVAEMLDKEPLLRCQSAAQVVHALAPLAAGVGSGKAVPPEVGVQPIRSAGAGDAPQTSATSATISPSVASVRSAETPPTPVSKPTEKPAPRPQPAIRPIAAKAQVAPSSPQRPGSSKPEPKATPEGKIKPAAHSTSKIPGIPRPKAAVRDEESIAVHDAAHQQSAEPVPSQSEFNFVPPVVAAADLAMVKPLAKPQRQPNSTLVIAAAVGVGAMIVLAGLLLSSRQSEAPSNVPKTASAKQQPATLTETTTDPKELISGTSGLPDQSEAPNKTETAATPIDDDNQTLWISPTAGQPLEVNYLPSGAQVFLFLRPAELLATAEGAKLFDALGPAGELAKAQLRAILGVELTQVEQLTIAFSPDDSGLPQAACVMRLRSAVPAAKLLESWGQPVETKVGAKQVFQTARLAYYLPPQTGERVVAIAPAALMKEMLELEGPPLVRKGIERLLRESDAARHFNLLLAPSYLLTDGKSLLVGDLEKLREPLAQFLDESLEAVLISAHLGDELFLEFRALGPVDQPPENLAKLLHNRLERVPDQVETYVASLQPRPYGRLVVNRFPRMVQLLSDFTRAGADGRQAVLRCYLPSIAAHNLLLATELTLFEEPAAPAIAEPKLPAPFKEPAGAATALQKRISLSFPRDTLEKCMEMLSKEIETEVVILGADLQLEGITKNQSFGLDERDQVAGEILQKVLKLANPDGKLVFVVKPKDGQGEAIFITTRAAAAKRGDRLSAEFSAKSP